MWLDEERMLILRTEVWSYEFWPTRYVTAVIEVSSFEPEAVHDPALFEFDPPPGARDATNRYPYASAAWAFPREPGTC